MKICFIADARNASPRNWVRYLTREGHEVHLISTYPCDREDLGVAALHVVPLDFSARVRAGSGKPEALTTNGSPFYAARRGHALWKMLVRLRNDSAPWAVRWQRAKVRRLIERIKPDLVHAMRIPFEGILAAEALRETPMPLIMSVWGNDFTLWAARPSVARLTRRALERADGLHPDCHRDLRLGRELGFGADRPAAVLPGGGGVPTAIFHPGPRDPALAARFGIPAEARVIICTRGVKPYIRTDTFFKSIPLVVAERPGTIFLGVTMQGNSVAEGWVKRLAIEESVRLLPFANHAELADYFRIAVISVSPSDHDGTPNSLLEAMACGVFPVAGDIESVREWIEDGVNGLLCDQGDPESLARAIIRAVDDNDLRRSAAEANRQLIADRMSFDRIMSRAVEFYDEVIADATRRVTGNERAEVGV